MSIQDAYDEWSGTYDSDGNLTRDLDHVVTRSRLGGLHFDSILEIGCGTGKNTVFLLQIGGTVQAVDFSEGMIAKAKEKVQADNVRFSIMDITQPWEFTNESFDLLVCNLVLEHVENLSHVFSESARVLRQNGNFFIAELHPFRQYDGKKAGFFRDGEKVEVDAFVHHISDFLNAAEANGLNLVKLEEYWHAEDQKDLPRILSLWFKRADDSLTKFLLHN
ncbi:MAG TPA: class I SAM-dependent methyltransferase, partial [Anaerolineales bacterium]|nr:class I SAM-dependent methyltransferase [Anaerolineales bacterium]